MPIADISADVQQRHREVLNRLTKEASRGDGLVYELFQSRFIAAVDQAAPSDPGESAAFLDLASTEFDYSYEDPLEHRDDNTCQHGLDEQTCPCGCFDH